MTQQLYQVYLEKKETEKKVVRIGPLVGKFGAYFKATGSKSRNAEIAMPQWPKAAASHSNRSHR